MSLLAPRAVAVGHIWPTIWWRVANGSVTLYAAWKTRGRSTEHESRVCLPTVLEQKGGLIRRGDATLAQIEPGNRWLYVGFIWRRHFQIEFFRLFLLLRDSLNQIWDGGVYRRREAIQIIRCLLPNMLSSALLNINVFPSSPSFIWYLFIRQFKQNWNGASISCLITAKCLFTDIRGANPTSHFQAICITATVMASARQNGRQSAKTTAAFLPLLLHYAFLCAPWETFSLASLFSL